MSAGVVSAQHTRVSRRRHIARGSVVDQDALIELLVEGRVAGAGLDVFAEEPYVPTELRELDDVVLSPHLGVQQLEHSRRPGICCCRISTNTSRTER